MTDNRDLLTFAEVAQRLSVGVLTIRQWVRTEQCRAVRDGRKVPHPGRVGG